MRETPTARFWLVKEPPAPERHAPREPAAPASRKKAFWLPDLRPAPPRKNHFLQAK